MKKQDVMQYLAGMEDIGSEILDEVLEQRSLYNEDKFSKNDVVIALNSTSRSPKDFAALLSPMAADFLEDMAQISMEQTRARFGANINVFTPLYISNYCDNNCIYCGFNSKNKIKRARLNDDELRDELKSLAQTGLNEILILTGESRVDSNLDYIANACKIAKEFFKVIGVEIYPLNSGEYTLLHSCGVDYVTVFQETYSTEKYGKIHLGGNKRIFPYRFNAQERAIMGGMRGVGFAALLGIDDFRKDAFATGLHAWLLQRKYPHTEISLSCPRLRPVINNHKINPRDVGEKELLQIIMAYRLFLPFANITISTRERALFRDNAVKIAANKISASVNVGIGSHSDKKGDEQFEIDDARDTHEVCEMLKQNGLTPVMSEYIYV